MQRKLTGKVRPANTSPSSLEPSSPSHQLQQLADQSPRLSQLNRIQRIADERPVLQRAVFRENNADTDTTTTHKKGNQIKDDSTATHITHISDTGLPTPYQVLVNEFGSSNINSALFKAKTSKYDRPRSVTARISADKIRDRNDPDTSIIGNMGDDELFIRQGVQTSFYDGGHLLGAKILGMEADLSYNIAPQEAQGNRQSYNNSIENSIRQVPSGSTLSYQVSLQYPINNFRVDQDTLIKRKILKPPVHTNKPYRVVIPSRIPQTWKADANITNTNNVFPTPGGHTLASTNPMLKNSDQAVDQTGVFGDINKGRSAFTATGFGSKKLHFYMKQYVPVDTTPFNPKQKHSKEFTLDNPDQYEPIRFNQDQLYNKIPAQALTVHKNAVNLKQSIENHPHYDLMTQVFGPVTMQAPSVPLITNLAYARVKRRGIRSQAMKTPKAFNQYQKVSEMVSYQQARQFYATIFVQTTEAFRKEIHSFQGELSSLKDEIAENITYSNQVMGMGANIKKLTLPELNGMYSDLENRANRLDAIENENPGHTLDQIDALAQKLEEFNDPRKFTSEITELFKQNFDQSLQKVASLMRSKDLKKVVISKRRSNRASSLSATSKIKVQANKGKRKNRFKKTTGKP